MATKIYLAGPLFSAAEIEFNIRLYDYLANKGLGVFLPQNECKGKDLDEIFTTCRSGVDEADVVLAVLDGADADSGTCWECGYAFAKGKRIVILRTDFRVSGDTKGFNAMLYFSADKVVESSDNYLAEVYEAILEL